MTIVPPIFGIEEGRDRRDGEGNVDSTKEDDHPPKDESLVHSDGWGLDDWLEGEYRDQYQFVGGWSLPLCYEAMDNNNLWTTM